MAKQAYWIEDPNGGAKAIVEGVEARDRWVHIHGWTESGEPAPGDQVWVYNPATDGRAKLPFETLDGYWKGVGFAPSAPPDPVDLTKDPVLRDQSPTAKPTTKPAAGADTKEK